MLDQCKSTPQVLWQQNHCGIFKSDNGGDSWVEVSEKEGPAIFGFAIAVDDKDPNIAYVAPGVSDEIRMAVDGQLCISKTIDGGKTWTAQRNGLPQKDAFDIVYRHSISNVGDRLMFGSTTGNVFYSNNGGDHWHVLSNYLPMVYAVEMIE